jgi:hypothetical protein
MPTVQIVAAIGFWDEPSMGRRVTLTARQIRSDESAMTVDMT